jgi:outer membrane protein OmpA-like peptidoglycan-associated protein
VVVPFQPGAADVAPDAQDALRALALRRAGAPMEAIGYGDAAGADPAGQSAALPLALARARAVAAVLVASGVPAAQVHVQAEAEGRGGAARIAEAGGGAGIADPGGAARNTN